MKLAAGLTLAMIGGAVAAQPAFDANGVRQSCQHHAYLTADECMQEARTNFDAFSAIWRQSPAFAEQALNRCVDDHWPRWELAAACARDRYDTALNIMRIVEPHIAMRTNEDFLWMRALDLCATRNGADLQGLRRCLGSAATAEAIRAALSGDVGDAADAAQAAEEATRAAEEATRAVVEEAEAMANGQ